MSGLLDDEITDPTDAEQKAAACLIHLIQQMIEHPTAIYHRAAMFAPAAVRVLRALPDALELEEPK